MSKPATCFLHPILLHSLASAEEAAVNLTPTSPQVPKAMAFPEGSSHSTSSPQPTTDAIPSPILPLPISLPSTPAPLPPPRQNSLDTEFHFIESELAKCKMTHDALSRREAALQERKRDILRDTSMRLDKEARELETRDEAEEEELVGEGVFMRDVGRRGRGGRKDVDVCGSGKVDMEAERNGGKEVRGNVVVVAEKEKREDRLEGKGKEEKKVIPMSAKERKRQGMIALLKADPRLACRP